MTKKDALRKFVAAWAAAVDTRDTELQAVLRLIAGDQVKTGSGAVLPLKSA